MVVVAKKVKRTILVGTMAFALMISCNDGKQEGQVSPSEQMPVKKLETDSTADMPVMKTTDSSEVMPNAYDTSPKPR